LNIKLEHRLNIILSAQQLVPVMFLQGSASYMMIALKLDGVLATKQQVLKKIEGRFAAGVDGNRGWKEEGMEANPYVVQDLTNFANYLYGYTLLNSSAVRGSSFHFVCDLALITANGAIWLPSQGTVTQGSARHVHVPLEYTLTTSHYDFCWTFPRVGAVHIPAVQAHVQVAHRTDLLAALVGVSVSICRASLAFAVSCHNICWFGSAFDDFGQHFPFGSAFAGLGQHFSFRVSNGVAVPWCPLAWLLAVHWHVREPDPSWRRPPTHHPRHTLEPQLAVFLLLLVGLHLELVLEKPLSDKKKPSSLESLLVT
jgi:hypothetical protein